MWLAFAIPNICGKYVSSFRASAYAEYFGQKMFAVGSMQEEIGLKAGVAYQVTLHALLYVIQSCQNAPPATYAYRFVDEICSLN